jgi:hypothetical protein
MRRPLCPKCGVFRLNPRFKLCRVCALGTSPTAKARMALILAAVRIWNEGATAMVGAKRVGVTAPTFLAYLRYARRMGISVERRHRGRRRVPKPACVEVPAIPDFSIGRSPVRSRLVNRLRAAEGGIVSNEELVDALYGDDATGGPITAIDVIKVMIYWLRRDGFPIKVHWGRGYSFEPTLWEVAAPAPVLEAA